MENIRTVLCDLPTDIKGYVLRKDDFFTIVLNSRLDYQQNIKTFMHESSHIIENDFDSNKKASELEIYAHMIGGCF